MKKYQPIWLRLENELSKRLNLWPDQVIAYGVKSDMLEWYFSGSVKKATEFLEALYKVNKRDNKGRHKRCPRCKTNTQDPITGRIYMSAHLEKCRRF
ncbi:MAG: hypothetical protein A2992_09230 [Elusimicrobia bacterium RIFCSPLOWO2_01_FULL_59_12]|nr:MAG: hypothetical protein A2992_09230 [Elusimicrobia bacterium RIFCSPLOWO2_01_FULL_59_12]